MRRRGQRHAHRSVRHLARPARRSDTRRTSRLDRAAGHPAAALRRAGRIEVRHYPTSGSDAYAVIPADALSQALADPALREGQDWGVGVGCVFTYHGLAIWRSEWSSAWNSRLTFD